MTTNKTQDEWRAIIAAGVERRLERERVAAIEAHIEVREWHDAAERAAFLREYGA